jgi:hypothetical protein
MKRLEQEEEDKKAKVRAKKKAREAEKAREIEEELLEDDFEEVEEIPTTTTFELDKEYIIKYICENNDVDKGFIKENKVYKRCLRPTNHGGVKSYTGRDYYLFTAILDIIEKIAPNAVKKVIRQDIQ